MIPDFLISIIAYVAGTVLVLGGFSLVLGFIKCVIEFIKSDGDINCRRPF